MEVMGAGVRFPKIWPRCGCRIFPESTDSSRAFGMTRRAGARENGCKDPRQRNFLNCYFHHEDRKKHEKGGLVTNGESQINKGLKNQRIEMKDILSNFLTLWKGFFYDGS